MFFSVGDSFIVDNEIPPSSTAAKPIFADVLQSVGMKGFYIHKYLMSAFPFSHNATGWTYGQTRNAEEREMGKEVDEKKGENRNKGKKPQ
ncbi:hypothetical protein [Stieleria varia]|uniref:hypothetical protein n=1 Tax=Stieleria varia TaxID=2528005 RepID=UPI0011B59E3D|nr:hypothetical protein [Stieleria varia]